MFVNSLTKVTRHCSIRNITNKCATFSVRSHSLSKRSILLKNEKNSCNFYSACIKSRHFCDVSTGISDIRAADNETDNIYDVDEKAITGGDPDKLKQLKILMLEIDVVRQEGLNTPSRITTDQWKELLECKSRSQKFKLLRFWFVNEHKRENTKIKRRQKSQLRIEKYKELMEKSDPNHIQYGLGKNTIFVRLSETTLNGLGNNRLVQAMKFGQDLVIDLSYEKHMKKKENSLCVKQLVYLFAYNRNHNDPFNIHFCNAKRDSIIMKYLEKHIPTIYNWEFPMNIHEKSYLDIFPKERLVYLTPHCRTELTHFSHDDIYIIGGLVDMSNTEPLSLAKAKSEGIRMAKFPLDKYLMWAMGSKSLTLDQCVSILLEVKRTGDWSKAFQFVPRRKVFKPPTQEELDNVEGERDKSSYFGQTYVATHEWGLNNPKRRHRAIDPPPVYDLRKKLVLHKKKSS